MGAQVSITTQLYLKSRLAAPFHRLKNVVSRTSNLGTIYSSKARVSASGDFFLPWRWPPCLAGRRAVFPIRRGGWSSFN